METVTQKNSTVEPDNSKMMDLFKELDNLKKQEKLDNLKKDTLNNLDLLKDIAFKQTEIDQKNFHMRLAGALFVCAFTGTGYYLSGGNINSTVGLFSLGINAMFGAAIPIVGIPVGFVGTMINLFSIYKNL